MINSAWGELLLEVHPLMPLSAVEIKSLNLFSDNVFLLTNGEIRIRTASFEPKLSPLNKIEKTSKGVYQASIGHTHLLAEKEPAALLFGAPPITDSIGFDNTTFFSWFYNAGGIELYEDMWDELNLNIKGFILQSSGPRALGWFREPFLSLDDLKGVRFRDSSDFSNSIHRKIGVSIIPLKGADIIPELEKKNLDGVSWCCPISDLTIGIHEEIDNFYLQGISKNVLNTDLYINRDTYNGFSVQQRKAIELAASTSIIQHNSLLVYENGKALKELIEDHNVIVRDTPTEYFAEYTKVVTREITEQAEQHDFFAKVWQSQKDFAIIGLPYWSILQNAEKGLYD